MSSPHEKRSPRWSSLCVFLVALGLLAGFARLHEVTVPLVHDEYAYLLSADTFVHGRLTNPSHPLWEHFETFHVLQHPSYQAKYPPAQGMALALGQWLGHPVVGVWISWALALAALHWMLSGLMRQRWALLGTLLTFVTPYLFLIWGQTYWGGAVATLGGALLFGGIVRLRQEPRLLDGLAIGTGLFLLGNSRPMEGVMTALLAMGLFATAIRRHVLEDRGRQLATRVLVPFGLGLALLVAWTLYYNWRVVGTPFTLPYFRYHPEVSPHLDIRSYTGSPNMSVLGKGHRLATGVLGLPLLAALPFSLRRLRTPYLLSFSLIAYVVVLLVLASSRAWPHYIAPVVPLLVFLTLAGLKALHAWRWRGTRIGTALAALVVLAHLGYGGRAIGKRIAGGPLESWAKDRLEMIERLEAQGGEHLVLVRYGPERERNKEWIYNAADIDASPVIWARDLGPEGNRELLAYYPERTLWRVDVPPNRAQLVPVERPRIAEAAGALPASMPQGTATTADLQDASSRRSQ